MIRIAIVIGSIVLLPNTINAQRSREDSLLIYDHYRGQVDSINAMAGKLDYISWYSLQDKKDSGLACAFLRLRKLNGKEYAPVRTKEIEGFGVAYEYPHPDSICDFAFTVIYPPTKFIVRGNGLTLIPYWEKYFFDKNGHRLAIKIIDPITLREIGTAPMQGGIQSH